MYIDGADSVGDSEIIIAVVPTPRPISVACDMSDVCRMTETDQPHALRLL